MGIEPEEAALIQPFAKKPLLFRALVLFIVVEGTVGFLFFLSVLLYQLFNPSLLMGWEYAGFSGTGLYLLIVVFLMLHIGIIISGVLLFRQQKRGLYLFTVSIFLLVIIAFLLNLELNWVGAVAGLSVLVAIFFFIKILR